MGKSKKATNGSKPPAKNAAPVTNSRWQMPEVSQLSVGIILAVAFFIRWYHLHSCLANDPNYLNFAGNDMDAYDSTAMQIVNGTLPKEPYSWYPGYTYFLAAIYFIFGHNPVTVMIIQCLIGCITCYLMYLMGKQLFNKPIGIIAALICSVYGRFIIYESVLLSTTWDTFLMTLSLFIGIKAVERKRMYFFVLGVILGIACLSRPNVLLVVPFFLIYILIAVKGIKRSLLANLLVIAGIVMMIAPVTARNYVYSHGKIIPIVTNTSMELWVGNNPDADGTYYVPPLVKEIKEYWEKLGKKDAYLADTIEFITKKPDKFSLLLLKKLAMFWNSEEIPDNNIIYERIKEKSPILRLPLIMRFDLIGPLALIGIVFLLIMGYSGRILLLYLVLFGYMNAVAAFFVQTRFRLPIIPCLIIFASFAIYQFYKNLWLDKNKKYLAFVVLFGIFFGLVNPHLYLRWLYPIIKPNGFYIEKRYGTIIRDDSNQWHGFKAVILNSEDTVLKKEIVIDFEPAAEKKYGIGLNMCYSCGDNGILSIEINGKKVQELFLSQFATNSFYRVVRLGIKNKFFKKGLNTIIFRVSKEASLQIQVDDYYRFRRSLFSTDNGKSWKVQNGEYRIYLDMQRGRVAK